MNITRLAIQNNRTTLVFLVVLVLVGLQAYQNIPRAYDPGFIIRSAQVITYFPGGSPERVEKLISDKIEKVVQELPQLDFVQSESRTGISIVTVNIKESYTEMRPIWDNLRRKVDKVSGDLPEGASTPSVNDEFGDVFGVVMALTGEGYSYAELKDVADQARDELLRISEVAKVEVSGEQEERVFVEYNNARLSELNLAPLQLSQILANQNVVVSGGSVRLGRERIELEPSGNFESIEDIRRATILLPNSDDVVYLEDIAHIHRGYKDPQTSVVRSSGVPALAIAVSMREGGNNIKLGKEVLTTINRFQAQQPIGLEFEMLNFSPKEVEDKVNDFVSNLVQAIVVVAAVMLFSLGLRTGLVVSTLIPASMIGTIFVMDQFGIGLDQISLAALIIALGMLVDNGIVMSESVMVEMKEGKSSMDAAIHSANELKVPLLTSSLTTSAAFLPIYLAESAMGEYTAALFQVVTITLLCSWVLSLTMIPLLCMLFLKVKKDSASEKDEFNVGFYPYYRRFLITLLQNRVLTIVGVVVLFFGSIQALQLVPSIFFPPSDRPFFKLEIELPIGTAIEQTELVADDVERHLNTLKANKETPEGVRNWITYVGSSGPRFLLTHNPKPSSPNYSLIVVNTTGPQVNGELMENLETYINAHHPDVKATARLIENGKAINNPVEVRVFGRDVDKLFTIVEAIKQKMAGINGLKNVSDNWGQRIKKLTVNVNQEKAKRAGVTSQDIAISLQTGLSGYEMTNYREGTISIPVVLRTEVADRQDLGKIQSLTVFSQATGSAVPLVQVADINVIWEPAKILRRDRLKTVAVGAQLKGDFTADEGFNQISAWLDGYSEQWPSGFYFEYGGEMESSGESSQSIADKLPIAIFIIVILLVMQFNSLRKPLIILSTIPLGFIGVVWGLVVANSFFGFMTLLGIISLAGIVINNAIVLLERIKLEIEVNGLSAQNAIVEAAQRRMRPILLTTATTVFGLLPLYIGGGEMWEPMAVGIMAGLMFSTLLTLGFIPVLYALLYKVNYSGYEYANNVKA
ncbi:MAG: efflux RND transporter permease subunit [Bermanella sp.]